MVSRVYERQREREREREIIRHVDFLLRSRAYRLALIGNKSEKMNERCPKLSREREKFEEDEFLHVRHMIQRSRMSRFDL